MFVSPGAVPQRSRTSFVQAVSLLAVYAVTTPMVRGEVESAPGIERGICAVLGGDAGSAERVVELARGSELLVYFQSADGKVTRAVREAAEAEGLLGTRVFVGEGSLARIGLAPNIAGAVLLTKAEPANESEVRRVLHPGGKSFGPDGAVFVKPSPEGVDSWSHPFHRGDNNPQSTDQLARAPYRTQFLAEPKFCPMPEVSVAAGGRVFRAFGHIAHKANQNAMLNTLIAVNAYNGTILWKRALSEGFMIHRNTLVATPDVLYLADQWSLKAIDAATGEVVRELIVPENTADGPVWKWMAVEGSTLHALVGAHEVPITTERSNTPGLGHWPWGMWKGHDYSDPKTSFGFGRNFIAVDLESWEILWNHREEEFVDARGVCMRGDRIHFYAPGKHLASLDTGTLDADGKPRVAWRVADPKLLEALGVEGRAQHYITGYATTSYIKATDDQILFAGPQRNALVVASARDGYLLWSRDGGNLQLVLRDDGIYAAGPQQTGVRLAYSSGKVLADLPTRRACTRATGSIDSVFYRTTGGTVRLETATQQARHIAPMRPPCQDGVIISDGYLYWGPWMCGCQLSLYGHIALGPAESTESIAAPGEPLEIRPDAQAKLETLAVDAKDWPTYRGDNARRGVKALRAPASASALWSRQLAKAVTPTAPVIVGDRVLVGDSSGAVRCLVEGEPRWTSYTGGAVYFPPAVENGRVFVASADGWLHCVRLDDGARLWRRRVAPEERRIPVYGKLISTWPLAGGVVVEDGVVYSAAGIAHYDGTHVVAVEVDSGALRWHNGTSGRLSESAEAGVSLQGELSIENGELRFAGGGRQQVARYDLATGKCLNTPRDGVTSQFQTAFYPYFPEYADLLAYRCDLADGRTLLFDASYEGSRHGPLTMLKPGPGVLVPDRRGDDRRRDAPAERRRRESSWEIPGERYASLVTLEDAVITAGDRGERWFLAAVDLESGERRWELELSAPVVRGGTAVDREGRVIVSLRDGRVQCFGEPSAK